MFYLVYWKHSRYQFVKALGHLLIFTVLMKCLVSYSPRSDTLIHSRDKTTLLRPNCLTNYKSQIINCYVPQLQNHGISIRNNYSEELIHKYVFVTLLSFNEKIKDSKNRLYACLNMGRSYFMLNVLNPNSRRWKMCYYCTLRLGSCESLNICNFRFKLFINTFWMINAEYTRYKAIDSGDTLDLFI